MATHARRDDVRNDWNNYPPRQQRNSISAKVRREILGDGMRCYLCGWELATEVDHIRPVCLGGTDDRDNLAGACRACHLSKSGREANHVRWHVLKIGPRKGAAHA